MCDITKQEWTSLLIMLNIWLFLRILMHSQNFYSPPVAHL